MTDLFPAYSASVVALNNLVRCLIGAAGVAVVDGVIAAVGPMPTFGAAVVTGLAAPLTFINAKLGPEWRVARQLKQATKEEMESADIIEKKLKQNLYMNNVDCGLAIVYYSSNFNHSLLCFAYNYHHPILSD